MMKFLRVLPAMLAAFLFASTPALAQLAPGPLPAVASPTGPLIAQPTVVIGYDSGTNAPCIVGLTATCSLQGSGGGGGGGNVTIIGTLPAYAAIPTFNLGTIGTAATAANQTAVQGTFGSTVGNNSRVVDNSGNGIDWSTTPALTAGTAIIGKVGIDQTTDGTTNAVHLVAGTALAGSVKLSDGTNTATVKAANTAPTSADTAIVVTQSPNPGTTPCSGAPIPINQTTSTDLKTFTNKGRLCSVVWISATAQNISLVEGTGTVCATGTVALFGGTSASAAFGANGGVSMVNDRTILTFANNADHLCLLQSGAGNISGFITYSDAS